MFALTLLVASIALADSVNPSTLIPGLWLARAPAAGRLASYTLGVFAVYLIGGLVLLFGPGRVMINALHHFHGPLEHVLEAVGGLLVLAVAFALWRSRESGDGQPRERRSHTRTSAFALGAGIMTIELPTAFMYFGAISAILAARPAAPLQISLLAGYNALFVAPLAVLLAVRRFAGVRVDRWTLSAEARLRYAGQLALSGVAAVAGAALLAIGLSGLLVF
jgi:cytochrome c biogenesis protein CcdA